MLGISLISCLLFLYETSVIAHDGNDSVLYQSWLIWLEFVFSLAGIYDWILYFVIANKK